MNIEEKTRGYFHIIIPGDYLFTIPTLQREHNVFAAFFEDLL